jgi:hypothetical protein
LTVARVAQLRALALIADETDAPEAITGLLAREAARLLRLVDRALAAHGRDHG